jgi:hypothetical protein
VIRPVDQRVAVDRQHHRNPTHGLTLPHARPRAQQGHGEPRR